MKTNTTRDLDGARSILTWPGLLENLPYLAGGFVRAGRSDRFFPDRADRYFEAPVDKQTPVPPVEKPGQSA